MDDSYEGLYWDMGVEEYLQGAQGKVWMVNVRAAVGEILGH